MWLYCKYFVISTTVFILCMCTGNRGGIGGGGDDDDGNGKKTSFIMHKVICK